jgi:aryl-alcohol dehydrogenase-like predicted oxidoreductase
MYPGKTNRSKLLLGTVQFGLKYGVNNSGGIPNDDELSDILNLAERAGIELLDSAPSYGNAEKRIGKYALGKFGIVTKFSHVSHQRDFKILLQRSLDNLDTEQVYGYIAHNSDELLSNPIMWDWLKLEREEGKVKKIGYSVYQPDQLKALLTLGMIPDLVQLPYNLLDKKFESYFSQLKDLGCEIHVRSVFLQGLFFMDTQVIEPSLKPLIPCLTLLQDICQQNNISMSELALGVVNSNVYIDKIVIGVENAYQLQKNVKDINSNKVNSMILRQVNSIKVESPNLLNPANW